MKYIVKRTSDWSDNKPCKEAKKELFPFWHTRTCTEEYFDKNFGSSEGLWKSKGKNHTITAQKYITRQEDDTEEWYIELNSLDELNSFQEKYGEIIVSDYDYAPNVKHIEIYDSYRE